MPFWFLGRLFAGFVKKIYKKCLILDIKLLKEILEKRRKKRKRAVVLMNMEDQNISEVKVFFKNMF